MAGSLGLFDTGFDTLSEVANVLGVDACHGNASASQQVDVILLYQNIALLLVQASVREHTDL